MASKSPRWSLAGLFKFGRNSPQDARTQAKTKTERNKPAGKAVGTSAKPAAEATSYHAVSIIPGVVSCGAAHRFTGQRFLSRSAPKLPLPSCDAAQCTCRFKHHKDRRSGPRRRGEIGMMQAHWSAPERRRTGGRRADDHL
jgi:hypothetical protein